MKSPAAVAVMLIAVPSLAFAHAGGVDKYGCHQNKAKNVYECHQGELKDQTFKSRAEAEKAMKGTKSGSAGKPSEQSSAVPQRSGRPATPAKP
jgi:hypothetical protein